MTNEVINVSSRILENTISWPEAFQNVGIAICVAIVLVIVLREF